ncbi:MAG TPA: VanW family protein [Anaerolineales bacterium]|nr:VanW family protein [Anaerolineales bacterium]
MVSQPLSQRAIELSTPSFLAKAAAALAAAFGTAALAAAVFSLGFSMLYLGRILPGVRVAGVDLSGRSPNAAIEALSQQLTYPLTGQVVLSYGDRSWTFTPAELGMHLDAEVSADAAYGFGRSLWPWENIAEKVQSLQGGADLAPRVVFDGQLAHQALQRIAAELNQPTIEAELSVQGLEVQMRPGHIGLTLDTEKTATWLALQLLLMQDVQVPLAVIETPPRILDVSAQAAIAQNMLSQPLSILPGGDYEDNPDPWAIEPETLASMLSVERVESDTGAHYQIGLDGQELGAILAGFGPQVAADPRNARFTFNDETTQLEIYKPAVIGRTLNLEASIEHINQAIAEGAHQVELQYDFTDPELANDVTAESMGITELVHEETTYFYGSSAERIHNISTASERFHGLLVPPGAVFSMVENIGDISLESGFAEALIIFGDRTIKGVGGGVCQVSTTLFRTVFFAGFPIIERYPHAYRVRYYEMDAAGNTNTNLVGLDATVYAPIVDFKFQNDTPYWLLMETYSNEAARTLTWKFYSTSDGRNVEWDTSGVQNVKDAPDPVYEENPELAKGVIKQVDWSAQGADVSITRWVYRDGSLLYEDFINTHFQAWADVFQYGPGTPDMPPKQLKGQNN